MAEQIKDGKGRGNVAGVNSNNQLEVYAQTASLQHVLSHRDGQAYQVWGTANLGSGTVIPLHIKNDNADRDLIATYIRWQVIDQASGTELPNASNYMTIALGRTYASGGAIATPINVNARSGNIPQITVYQSNPTLAGTAKVFDRWYPKAEGDMNVWNKEGTVILGRDDTLELAYVGDHTSGIVFARVSFIMGVVGDNDGA